MQIKDITLKCNLINAISQNEGWRVKTIVKYGRSAKLVKFKTPRGGFNGQDGYTHLCFVSCNIPEISDLKNKQT